MASVYEGKKSFECDFCDANFAQKDQLKKHAASVHEKKKPFNCEFCEANFARKDYLKNIWH